MKRLALLLILLAAPAAADEPASPQMQAVYDVTAILNGMALTPAGAAEVHEILHPTVTMVVLPIDR